MLRKLLFSSAEGKQIVKTKGRPGTASGFNGTDRLAHQLELTLVHTGTGAIESEI